MLKTLTLIVSIVVALALVVLLGVMARPDGAGPMWERWQHQSRRGALTEEQRQWAEVAWRYVQNNTQPGTGLVNGKDRYPVVSLWNIGDSLIAVTAARRLNLIPQQEFDARLAALLTTLDRLPLTRIGAPGALYDAANGTFSQNGATTSEAQGMARLLGGMRLTAQSFPEYRTFLERIALRWNFCELLNQDGQPLDGRAQNGDWRSTAAVDVGYADYSRAAFGLWGFPHSSTGATPHKTAIIYGVPVEVTARDPRLTGAPAGIESTPYLLTGLEMGWAAPHSGSDSDAGVMQRAQRLYQVQEMRWRQEKILTARAQYSRSSAPWEVYDSLFANGYPWNTLADDGRYAPELALLSTRAIFGLWALWDTRYTDALMQLGRLHQDDKRGWFEGRYEANGGYNTTFTLTTNTVVLEALLFKQNRGPLLQAALQDGYLDARMKDIFNWPRHCLPQERHPLPSAKGG
ncbi:hypothetical protein BHU62_02515 [Serratia marcescens]|uniref:DUF3131 domain-containing protein n=1 Tax=Serratia marcescens TaxID=615 RepID=A0A1Q4P598_SERMA|nr:DUF3131 domain-containing protein [Serratia marcescens]OKB68361.1 hypothetical protein BHU62_02515 [Serratia marcescens]